MQHLPPFSNSPTPVGAGETAFAIDEADFAAAKPATPRPRVVSRRAQRAEAATARSDQDGAFDALTDLFLGEVARPDDADERGVVAANAGDEDPTGAPTTTSEIVPPPSRPVLRLRRDEDEPTGAGVVSSATTEADVQDADGASGEPETPGPKVELGQPVVECVVLGNLPVLASAWASQYVREVANACGKPVAYVRVQAGFASVEIVGQWKDHPPIAAARCASVEDALAAAKRITDRWIFRVETAQVGGVLDGPLVRALTLLTGTDEAARVAAYDALRAMASSVRTIGDAGPMVRLAVMGAGEEPAAGAGRVLSEAAQKELGRNVAYFTCSARISAGRTPAMLYSGPVETDVAGVMHALEIASGVGRSAKTLVERPASEEPRVAEVIRIAEVPRDELTLERVSAPVVQMASVEAQAADVQNVAEDVAVEANGHATIQTVIDPSPAVPSPGILGPVVLSSVIVPLDDAAGTNVPGRDDRHERAVVDVSPRRSEPVREPPAVAASVGARRSLVPEMDLPSAAEEAPTPPAAAPVPSPMPVFAATRATPQPELFGYVRGVTGMSWDCPYAPGVHIGADDTGRLHLLVRANGGETQGSIAALMVASSWARTHAKLIARATGASGPLEEPELHIFTDRPKDAVRLIDSGVRVHVLAEVQVEGRTGWFCTDLN